MSGHDIALLFASAGVGLGHAVLPDHWVPLAVLGRTRHYEPRRIARLSLAAGVAHVLVSIVLGALIIAVGLPFRHAVQSAQDYVVGGILIATGVAFAAIELTGHGHTHDHDHDHDHDHEHEHEHEHEHAVHGHPQGGSATPEPPQRAERLGGLAAVMVPFGAAASPDLTILPVFLAATTAGLLTAACSLVVFAAVTIGTIVSLTLIAARGGYQVRGEWLDRWGNAFTAAVLSVIGLLVLTGVI